MLSKYTGKRRKQAITGLLFILPSLAGVMVFVFFPFLDVLCQSFQGPVLREWRGIENYRILFETSAFRLAAMNTLRFTAVCIPVLVVLSLLLAIVLQNIGTSGRIFKSAFLVPMAVPVASVVLFWRVMFHEKGLLNALLAKLGGISKDWMNTGTAFWILVGSYIGRISDMILYCGWQGSWGFLPLSMRQPWWMGQAIFNVFCISHCRT